MTILITGGAGYIGSHMAYALTDAGERIVVLYLEAELQLNGLGIRGWCKQLGGRGLPSLWIPSTENFYPVTELPVLGSGKLDLRRLKELALQHIAVRT